MRRCPIVSVVEVREVSTNSRLRADLHHFSARGDRQRDWKLHQSADRDAHILGFRLAEARCFHRDRVRARRQQSSTVAALSVARGGAFQTFRDIAHRNRGVHHKIAARDPSR